MSRVILFFFLLLADKGFSQQSTPPSKARNVQFTTTDDLAPKLDSVHTENIANEGKWIVMPKPPEFPPMRGTLEKYTKINLHYPENALKRNIRGFVVVSFIVIKDGSITDVKIVQGLEPDCDKEAIRFVKLMPRWIPGDLVPYYLIVRFIPPTQISN